MHEIYEIMRGHVHIRHDLEDERQLMHILTASPHIL